jgi:serine phosphatase RsbU (regulator of sigma subunit)
VLENLTFRATDRTLPKRARVLMYTDGMTEVTDGSGEQIGAAPLIRILEESAASGLDTQATAARLAAVQKEVAGDAPASDDRTFLLLVEDPSAAGPETSTLLAPYRTESRSFPPR